MRTLQKLFTGEHIRGFNRPQSCYFCLSVKPRQQIISISPDQMGRQTFTFRFQSDTYCRRKIRYCRLLVAPPYFRSPQPYSFDEQFVVKSIQNFFSACTTVGNLYNKECNYAPIPNPVQFLTKNTSCINICLYIDRSLQTMDVNTCTYPQEGVEILTKNSNHSGKMINFKSTPQGGGNNLCTNLNQSQFVARHKMAQLFSAQILTNDNRDQVFPITNVRHERAQLIYAQI